MAMFIFIVLRHRWILLSCIMTITLLDIIILIYFLLTILEREKGMLSLSFIFHIETHYYKSRFVVGKLKFVFYFRTVIVIISLFIIMFLTWESD